MSVGYQIVVDCHDPHRLAAFWAAAMDLEVEDHDAQVRHVLDQGHLPADSDAYVEHEGRLRWRAFAACSGDGGRTRLLFQVVDDPTEGKNRVHLDLRAGDDRRDAEVARLEQLGATRLWEGQQGPLRWVTMADPEGNEFCVG
ncbi:MAG TPA: VOC family protein [Euzebyales bacterium]